MYIVKLQHKHFSFTHFVFMKDHVKVPKTQEFENSHNVNSVLVLRGSTYSSFIVVRFFCQHDQLKALF